MSKGLKYDVAAIGSATHDSFLEGDFKIIPYKQTPSGRALLFPFGEKLGVKKFYSTIGGNAANASVTFAKQGLKTAVAAPVGADLAGEEVKRKLKGESVDISQIVKSSELTAYSVLLLDKGERTILNYPGASNKFSLKAFDLKQLKAKWWYVSLPGKSHHSFAELMKIARRMGIKVAFNPSMQHIIEGRKELLRLLPELSFLVLNEGEAAALAGISFRRAEAVFKKLDKLMPGVIAVTSGPKGVTVSDNQFIYRAGIFKEKRLADRTGAGDAFGSGFVAGLIRRGGLSDRRYRPEDVEYAIRLASANATAAVEEIGATEGLLTRREFDSANRFRSLKISRKRI